MTVLPDVTSYLVAGWPWWWLLVFLLSLLLLVLLCCCSCYCLHGRKNRSEARYISGQNVPLLDSEKADSHGKGNFEDGYTRGFRDGSRGGSAADARRIMGDEYGAKDDRFHEGYTKGLRDAGITGMTKSMHDLAQRGGSSSGYSAGYMQGFRDGNSGAFGDRITDNLLRRLEDQYPGQNEFKNGYIDGFKEGASGKSRWEDSRRLQQSLSELTERLASIERSKGDEIHSTKIYHVYNQQPDTIGTRSTGEKLAHELDDLITSDSRRGTLRKHYTPGDYLKEAGEENYGTYGNSRRSRSASALGRETTDYHQRFRYNSGTSYIDHRSALNRQESDTSSTRYNYRSQSEIGSPRLYASPTLLYGTRPSPTEPHRRREAVHSLQRELDSLSRSPVALHSRGYSSDTGYIESKRRAIGHHYSASHDYDSYPSTANRSEYKSPAASAFKGTPIPVVRSSSTAPDTQTSSQHDQKQIKVEHQQQHVSSQPVDHQQSEAQSSHHWADDLIEIVHEPMGQTLDRMRRFSNSLTNIDKDDGTKDGHEEK